LSKVYRERIGREPELTRTEGLVLEAYETSIGDDVIARLTSLLDEKPYVADRVRERAATKLLYRQPAILLVYLFASEKPAATKLSWPLTPAELRPIYVDLGKTFDDR
jgi:hypothetical protein